MLGGLETAHSNNIIINKNILKLTIAVRGATDLKRVKWAKVKYIIILMCSNVIFLSLKLTVRTILNKYWKGTYDLNFLPKSNIKI